MRNINQVASIFWQSDEVSQIRPGYIEKMVGEWGNEIFSYKMENIGSFERYTEKRYCNKCATIFSLTFNI